MPTKALTKKEEGKLVPTSELIFFLMGTFFLTTLTGMCGNYRQAYLVDVLGLGADQVSSINLICSVVSYLINFLIMMRIDRPPKKGNAKFLPLVRSAAIPFAIVIVLMYYTPSFIDRTTNMIVIWCICLQLIYNTLNTLAGSLNNVAVVISPNSSERDTALTWRGIVNAVGNSAPLVVVAVAGAITKKAEYQYLGSAIACSIVAVIFMLIATRKVKERVKYNPEKKNPLEGYKDIIKNKYAWIVIISEFLKNFRGVASYMGVFLAAALLGSSSKFLLLGLPTGIGTFVGMLIVKAFMKKFNTKQIYIASGIYSLIANSVAFAVGYAYFKSQASGNENPVLQIVFIATLFLIGLQFGASNLCPALFQADILEDIEVKTHKRLDATLGFVCGIGSTISGIVAQTLAPEILYGDSAISVIGYVQPIEGEYPEQAFQTKVMLLFFYTIVHGIMMLLAGVPYLFYKLTGTRKEEVHAAVLAYRESLGEGNETSKIDSAVTVADDMQNE